MFQYLQKIMSSSLCLFVLVSIALAEESSWLFYQSNKQVLALERENEYMWIGTSGGILRIHTPTNFVDYYYNLFSDPEKSFIYSIAIDCTGTKWFGTSNGIISFDGSEWTTFDTTNSDLPNQVGKSLAIDQQNRLWIGTSGVIDPIRVIYGKGVACFDGDTWSVYDTSNSDIPANRIETVCVDKRNKIWVGTYGGGLAAFDGETWEIYNVTNSGLPTNCILSLAVSLDSSLWIGSMEGLTRYNGETWTTYNSTNSILPYNYIFGLYIDENGVLWAGCCSYVKGALVRIEENEWTLFDEYNSNLKTNVVWTICKDLAGKVWVGTNTGLFTILNSECTFYDIGLGTNKLKDVKVDEFGKIWVGGEDLYAFDYVKWDHYNSSNSPLPNSVIETLYIDSQNRLWAGTQEGIAIYDKGEWQIFNNENSGLPGNLINCIKSDVHNTVWIGTSGSGLASFDEITWDVYKRTDGLPSNIVNDIMFDKNHHVWIATSNGLGFFDGSSWIKYNTSNTELPSNNLNVLAYDDRTLEDIVWIGTNDAGIVCYANNRWTSINTSNSELPSDQITSLTVDKQGIVWIGTPLGLASYDGTSIAVYPELRNKSIESIFVDGNNTKWVTIWDEGLAVYNENGLVNIIEESTISFPVIMELLPCYPNPFNPTTTLYYILSEPNYVNLSIYDITGKQIEQLVNHFTAAGYYTLLWDASQFSSGIYFARLQVGNTIKTQKMLLIK
ncbi:MAG: two-component regulator propeller domain-containing protein [Candidatus Marinimicrobia bacterium]|nr:two-component regulator propeller domain-containing protein [Candidatus Neomarinimicrobiota bacterium]